jgi:hypothetical protein
MYINRFGQESSTADPGVIVATSPGSAPSSGVPVPSLPSGMPVSTQTFVIPTAAPFSRFMMSRPGPPYVQNLKPQDVEKAIYKDLPISATTSAATPTNPDVALSAQGADPTQIVQLHTGLEVPAYILQREADRKKAAEMEAASYSSVPPPRFYSIGAYSMKFPAKATIIALIAGYLVGNYWKKK